MPQARRIVPDGGIRAGLNVWAPSSVPTQIPPNRFVKDSTNADEVTVPTAQSQQLKGVTMQAIDPALTGDVQVSGKATVEASAAISKGAKVGSQANTGKAITVSAAGDYVGGIAATAAGADGDVIEVELIQPSIVIGGPTGPTGPTGATGPTGPTGA